MRKRERKPLAHRTDKCKEKGGEKHNSKKESRAVPSSETDQKKRDQGWGEKRGKRRVPAENKKKGKGRNSL